MAVRVLIIGGYGKLGSCIARQLVQEEDTQLIIAGRDLRRAEAMAVQLSQLQLNQTYRVKAEYLDIDRGVSEKLFEMKPALVIHTAGPFREQGYQVASACMEIGAHYIDLATDPGFVDGMMGLRNSADDKGVLIVSGASAKPCLPVAVIDQFQRKFKELQRVEYRHSKSLSSLSGTATIADLLGQLGEAIDVLSEGQTRTVYGWQQWRWLRSRGQGLRLLANSSPTLAAVFPTRYPSLSSCRFFEGVESKSLQILFWLLSWPGRINLLRHVEKAAPLFRQLVAALQRFDSATDIFAVQLTGISLDSVAQSEASEELEGIEEITTLSIVVQAKAGAGIDLQCMPAILLARKLLHGKLRQTGVVSCAGMITLREYKDACEGLEISWKAGA